LTTEFEAVCLQDRVYQKRVGLRGVDKLKQRVVEVWSHFSQAMRPNEGTAF